MTHARVVKAEALSIVQVATVLHVSEGTVRGWIRDGSLHAFRAGKKLWRIPIVELRRLQTVRRSEQEET